MSLAVEALQGKMCQNSLPSGGLRSLGGKISGGRDRPPANILIPLERQLMQYNFAADSFYILKLCSRLFVLYCRSRPKDDKSRHFDPHFVQTAPSTCRRFDTIPACDGQTDRQMDRQTELL